MSLRCRHDDAAIPAARLSARCLLAPLTLLISAFAVIFHFADADFLSFFRQPLSIIFRY